MKFAALTSVIVFYGLAAFLAGKYSAGGNISSVKGVRTESNADQIDKPQPFSDVQSGSVIASTVNFCSNTVYSFQLSYPSDWFTTYNNKYQECTFFAPFSFVVPGYPEHDIVPINVVPIAPSDWQTTVKLYENPNDYQNVSSTKNIEINGRSVEIIDSTSTGNGFVPIGLVKRSYLVFDGRVPLVIYYQQLSSQEDVIGTEKILNDVVSSLKYF